MHLLPHDLKLLNRVYKHLVGISYLNTVKKKMESINALVIYFIQSIIFSSAPEVFFMTMFFKSLCLWFFFFNRQWDQPRAHVNPYIFLLVTVSLSILPSKLWKWFASIVCQSLSGRWNLINFKALKVSLTSGIFSMKDLVVVFRQNRQWTN
jgi:hypothetical protein